MVVNPGELNKRITIVTIERVYTSGIPTETQDEYHACWAKFSRTSGTENFKAGKDMDTEKVRFLIRYKSGITNKMAVVYNGETYDIKFTNDYGDEHKYIEIWCEKVS